MTTVGQHNDSISDRLQSAGVSPQQASAKSAMFGQAIHALGIDALSAKLLYVPGRIEMLGKHTDYCGGRSLLVTAERGFCLAVAPRTDSHIEIHSLAFKDSVRFPFSRDLQPKMGHWSNYPMTVARRIARNFPGANRGVSIAIASDLPAAAGMSSSSALVVAMFMAISQFNELETRPEYRAEIRSIAQLANYMACNENGKSCGSLAGDNGVGTFGGSQDHTAILCCKADTISQFAFCPTRFERDIPMPADHTIVLGVSGVIAEKTGNALEKYNEVSLRVRRILEAWNEHSDRQDLCLADAVHSSTDAADRIRELIRGLNGQASIYRLTPRFEQFLRESEHIIPAAGEALIQGDMRKFGQLIDLSQKGAEEDLGNQIPETISLCRTAREAGAVAASAFGAGFGGAVWTLIPNSKLESYMERWNTLALQHFKHREIKPEFIITHPGPAATWL